MKTITIASLFAFGVLVFFGCKTADNAVDCQGICDRYQECFDESYDVSDCTERCLDDASNEGYDTQADACDACIDDKSCASATFNCATKCAGIVP
jgi:hypothetical protein